MLHSYFSSGLWPRAFTAVGKLLYYRLRKVLARHLLTSGREHSVPWSCCHCAVLPLPLREHGSPHTHSQRFSGGPGPASPPWVGVASTPSSCLRGRQCKDVLCAKEVLVPCAFKGEPAAKRQGEKERKKAALVAGKAGHQFSEKARRMTDDCVRDSQSEMVGRWGWMRAEKKTFFRKLKFCVHSITNGLKNGATRRLL